MKNKLFSALLLLLGGITVLALSVDNFSFGIPADDNEGSFYVAVSNTYSSSDVPKIIPVVSPEICNNGIDDDGDGDIDCADSDCNTTSYASTANGSVRNGAANNATGAPDGVTTEIGATTEYLVLTLPNEIVAGTNYTIYISGRGGSATTDVWEAPDGTSLPSSQQNSPSGFTQNGQATGPNNTIVAVSKVASVNTRYLYLDRGSGDIEIDAVEISVGCGGCAAFTDFDSDPSWISLGNTSNGSNFGYSASTNNTGGDANNGEIGGTFARGSTQDGTGNYSRPYYGTMLDGTYTQADDFSISGEFYYQSPSAAEAMLVFCEYGQQQNTNFIGIHFNDQSGTQLRATTVIGDDDPSNGMITAAGCSNNQGRYYRSTDVIATANVASSFTINYDAGTRTVSGTIGGNALNTVTLPTGLTFSIDAFALTMPACLTGTGNVSLWVDAICPQINNTPVTTSSVCHGGNDNDRDAICDFFDLDDDNDGILDDVEGLGTNTNGTPADCTFPVFDFTGPVLESGTGGTVGAIYRYSNVTTGVDALVEIVGITNTSLHVIDDESSGTGFTDAFQPMMDFTTVGKAGIEFNFKFVDAGTSTLAASVDRVGGTAFDVDGDGVNTNESYLFESPSTVGLENPSFIDIVSSGTDVEFIADGTYEGTGVDPDSRLRIYFLYDNTNEFNIHFQVEKISSVPPFRRRFSLRFDECQVLDFSNINLLIDSAEDTDNDGVPNHLDLDSDNDGILDLDEAGHSAVDANDDGIIDGAASLFGDNGFFDALETSADNGVANYTVADSENTADGNYDAYETDADGDGCFDATEESIADGDNDGIAGTGTPTVDGDGLVTTITYTSPSNNDWQDPNQFPIICGTPPPCSGHADNVVAQSGVPNSNDALGAIDATGAQLWDNGDQLVLDLTDEIGIGENYTVRWRRDPGTGGNPSVTLEESTDGTSWTTVGGSPFTFSNTNFFNQTIATSMNVRYLRFTTNNVFNADIDAVLYSCIDECDAAASGNVDTDGDNVSNICDLDDDNDGITDNDESGFSNYVTLIRWTHNENDPDPGDPEGHRKPFYDNTLISTPYNETNGSGVQLIDPGSSFAQVNNINTNSFAAAVAANDYLEYRFVTAADYGSKAYNLDAFGFLIAPMAFGSSADFGIAVSSDGFASSQVIIEDVPALASAAGSFIYTEFSPTAEIQLYENTEYTFRIYFYNLVDDPRFAFDDFTIYLWEHDDFDQDGIANYLDSDSDNDGIFDVDEAGHSAADANDDGIIDGAASLFGTNGLFDALETSADNGILNYPIADSELTPDGTYDAYELDADGDGCNDTDEEGISDGDGDGLAGAGVPVVDANGLVTSITYASPTNNFWQNPIQVALACDTDNDNIPPTVDLDDDNDGIPDVEEAFCNTSLSFIGWSHNENDPPGELRGHFKPSFNSTYISSGNDETAGSGLVLSSVFSNGLVTGVDSKTLAESISSQEYLSYAFSTTSSWSEPVTINTISRWHVAFLQNVGTSFKYSLLYSTDGFVSSQSIISDVSFVTTGTAGPDTLNIPSVSLAPSTNYEFRIYFYDLQGDTEFAWDDFVFNGCQNFDTDQDGISNYLDLDSDNDGILDVDEAGHTATDANNDGVIDGAASLFGTNGLFDALETTVDNGTLNYTIADSETTPDGTYNAYELDSDDDGCFDAKEENISDTDDDGLAGTGVPAVDANGLVTSITYTSPVVLAYLDSNTTNGCGSIAGTIFEDINYGGGEGRDYAAANTSAQVSGWTDGAIGLENVRVELYTKAGAYLDATTTDANGDYQFSDVLGDTLQVRVVNSTVSTNQGRNFTGIPHIPVQTFEANGKTDITNQVGGNAPTKVDANSNTSSATLSSLVNATSEPISLVSVPIEGAMTGVDFGFNYSTIVNTNSSGQGSLHQFIINANELQGTNLDQEDTPVGSYPSLTKPAGWEHSLFMIPGSGTQTINLTTNLPEVTDDFLHITGYTQFGAVQGNNSNRQLTIQLVGNTTSFDCIRLSEDNIAVSGLVMNTFRRAVYTYEPASTNVHIWGNIIGLNADGTTSAVGGNYAIHTYQSEGAFIGTNGDGVNDENEGNIISNFGMGIFTQYCENLNIAGNWVGLSRTGNASVGHTTHGMEIELSTGENVIGFDDRLTQTDPAILRNVISGNGSSGIRIDQTDSIRIAGNYIGTNSDGNSALANESGIRLIAGSSDAIIGTDADGTRDTEERNIISGNGVGTIGGGIWIDYTGANLRNKISGNYIGTDITGNNALGNLNYGVHSFRFNDYTIVGTDGDGVNDAIEGNVVSANSGDGIIIREQSYSTVAGNYVGVGADGTTALGNDGDGIIVVGSGTSDISVGCGLSFSNTTVSEIGNTIRNNTGTGLFVTTGVGTNNCLRNNVFGNNGELGIDIRSKGVENNDNGDGDTGPNGNYNYPILISTNLTGNTLTVTGFSRPGAILDFYIADAGPNPNPLPVGYITSFGEGVTIIGTATEGSGDDLDNTTGSYVEDGKGGTQTRTTNRFEFQLDVTSLGVTNSDRITAIATEPGAAANTSEFSGLTTIITPEICNDGIDNDGDGLVDCLDDDCDTDLSCSCDNEEEYTFFVMDGDWIILDTNGDEIMNFPSFSGNGHAFD
ncbi:MAG: hypothetical protein AAF573_02940, partial [Bacteroidota bacterium]